MVRSPLLVLPPPRHYHSSVKPDRDAALGANNTGSSGPGALFLTLSTLPSTKPACPVILPGGGLDVAKIPPSDYDSTMATRKKPTINAQTVVPKPTGRPSRFSQELADEIVARVATGEPLAPVCRDVGLGLSTWYEWCRDRADLAAAIARAREAGEEIILAGTLEIADAPPPLTAMGATDSGAVQHAKLRIDTRLKLLAKWNPRKWGEKVQVGGADDLPALKTEANITLDPSEAYKRLLGGKS